jgi:formylglycine-generating enzyme required for sulfatase activity
VYLDAYYIATNLVTVGQYRAYCYKTKGHVMPYEPGQAHDADPIMSLTWDEAQSYADWAGGGARLPTEAEWEKAARGTDGSIYPWGKTFVPRHLFGTGEIAPVGSFPEWASPYGVQDMVGSVYQWCADWYDPDYYKTAQKSNPTGPSTGSSKVRRGCWSQAVGADSANATVRSYGAPDLRLGCDHCGIRLAWSYTVLRNTAALHGVVLNPAASRR